jgi:hypothetical protein
MTQLIDVYNEKELKRKINGIKSKHESLNQGQNITIEINPRLSDIVYHDYKATTISITVHINDEEDEE